MKKVLIISDGETFPQCAFDYACVLNEAEPILLTSLFLPPMNYILSLTEPGRVVAGLPLPDNYVDVATVSNVISTFKTECLKHGLEYRVHSEHTSAGSITDDITLESRFADLIVMGNEKIKDELETDIQDEAISTVLHYAECPVVIAPDSRHRIERVIMAYDGSATSVHAIKQFIYLFPQYAALETEIVYAHAREELDFPSIEYLKEFAGRHLSRLTFTKLNIAPKQYFETWLTNQANVMLVTGSGGRSWMSQLLKKSFIYAVIDQRKVSIFTAHK